MAFDRARGAVNATIQQRTARLNAMISSQIQNLYASQEGPSSPASSSSSSATYPQSAPSSSTFSSSGGVYFGNSTQATAPKPQGSAEPSTNPVLSFLSKHGTSGQPVAVPSSSSSSAQRSAPRTAQAPASSLDCRSLELRLSTEPPVEAPKPSYSDALYDVCLLLSLSFSFPFCVADHCFLSLLFCFVLLWSRRCRREISKVWSRCASKSGIHSGCLEDVRTSTRPLQCSRG
jgi:hypothetical protein